MLLTKEQFKNIGLAILSNTLCPYPRDLLIKIIDALRNDDISQQALTSLRGELGDVVADEFIEGREGLYSDLLACVDEKREFLSAKEFSGFYAAGYSTGVDELYGLTYDTTVGKLSHMLHARRRCDEPKEGDWESLRYVFQYYIDRLQSDSPIAEIDPMDIGQ